MHKDALAIIAVCVLFPASASACSGTQCKASVELDSAVLLQSKVSISPPVGDVPIDVVYCWAGESMQVNDTRGIYGMGAHDGHGLNEMEVSFRSLQKYLPWFNKVHVLVNGPANPPAWAVNDTRLVMVDRCALFPRGLADCPTKNTHACRAVVHHIPGLNEHFIYMDDDHYFVSPMTPSDFFSVGGQPLIDITLTEDSFSEVYGPPETLPKGPDMPPEHLPRHLSANAPGAQHAAHSPAPMLLSFMKSMAQKYGDWYAFVQSHKTRFSCCDAIIGGDGWHEDFLLVYYWMLFTYKAGEQRPGCRGPPCKCDVVSCFGDCLQNPRSMVVNFNNQDVENWGVVHKLLLQHMGL